MPTPWTIEDAGALQALANGNALPHQQVNAMRFIIEQLSGYYEISFRAGADGDRLTAFSEGKRHVGQQIVKLTRINLGKWKATPSEQP